MKIQIIGYSGSGKSTLCKILSKHYNIPLLYLDTVRFYGDWEERPNEEMTAIVDKFLNENSSWVIDGNYTSVSPNRFNDCDIVIYLNYNRFFCLTQVIKRYFKYRNTTRESITCKEKIDWDFIKWVFYKGRTKERKQRHLNNFNKCYKTRLMFKSRRQLMKFLKKNNIEYKSIIKSL